MSVFKRLGTSAVFGALVLLLLCPTAYATTDITWYRVGGETALDTMELIVAKDGVTGFSVKNPVDTVVVTTVSGWWDGLSCQALAGMDGAPVVMTDGTELSAQARRVIETLKPSKAVIVGGDAAVSENVARQVGKLVGSDPERVAGQDAVGTALSAFRARSGWSDTAFVATSATYQDALSAGPFAYSRRCPIFLADASGHLGDEVLEALSQGGFKKVVVLGGDAAVPVSEEARIAAATRSSCQIERLAGQDAVATCAEVIKWETTQGFSGSGGAAIASADGWWDALSAASCCGRNNLHLALVDRNLDNQVALHALAKVQQTGEGTYYERWGVIVGGTAAVADRYDVSLPLRNDGFYPA